MHIVLKLLLGLGIILVILFSSSVIANITFKQMVMREVTTLFLNDTMQGDPIKKEDLEHLPAPIQRWLETSQVIGKERVSTLRLKQQGIMRIAEDGAWMPFTAEQYVTANTPGFIWYVDLKVAQSINISGRDIYYEGKGNMLIKLLSLIPVVDAKGYEIDQGTMLRYLGETLWYPSASLNPYIEWEEINNNTAKATMTYGDIVASGIFTFDDQGQPMEFTAMRYREVNGESVLTPWLIEVGDHIEFDGIIIPSTGTVIWQLETGNFDWFKFEVTDLEYNMPYAY